MTQFNLFPTFEKNWRKIDVTLIFNYPKLIPSFYTRTFAFCYFNNFRRKTPRIPVYNSLLGLKHHNSRSVRFSDKQFGVYILYSLESTRLRKHMIDIWPLDIQSQFLPSQTIKPVPSKSRLTIFHLWKVSLYQIVRLKNLSSEKSTNFEKRTLKRLVYKAKYKPKYPSLTFQKGVRKIFFSDLIFQKKTFFTEKRMTLL